MLPRNVPEEDQGHLAADIFSAKKYPTPTPNFNDVIGLDEPMQAFI